MRSMLGCRAAVVAFAALMAVVAGRAQSPASTNPDQDKSSGASSGGQTGSGQEKKPGGKVLFERSLDGRGNAVSTTGAEATKEAKLLAAPVADDAERTAAAVTRLDLDVRLNTEAQQIAVRGVVTVRNAGSAPLKRIPLQAWMP